MIRPPPRSTLFPTPPLSRSPAASRWRCSPLTTSCSATRSTRSASMSGASREERSEEHTSELQSQSNLVCRLLLEKKKTAAERAEIEQQIVVLDVVCSRVLEC